MTPPSVQDLIDAGRSERLPAGDRARLRAKVAEAVAAPRPGPRWVKPLGGALGVAALVAAGWLQLSRGPAPLPAPTAPATVEVSSASEPWAAAPPVVEAPPAPQPPAPSASQLMEETRLLRAAQRALASKDGARALESLDAHAQRFPDGLLREERDAARVLALCQLGRVNEAHALAAAFLERAPASPQAARVRNACSGR